MYQGPAVEAEPLRRKRPQWGRCAGVPRAGRRVDCAPPMPTAPHQNHPGRSPLAALLGVWARLLVAAIATLVSPAAAHALTPTAPLAAENSPLGLGRNPAPARALAELPQAPESPLESAFAYAQTAVDNAYATRGALRFTQTTASPMFSAEGAFAGRSINQVAGALRSGAMNAAEVPVEFIERGGARLIVNTRSSLALRQAGIPESGWTLINRTGVPEVEANITGRLLRNGLGNEGTEVLRITGSGPNASTYVWP